MVPTPREPENPQPFPVLAALSPVALGVVLWAVTGSSYALLFAAFGPVIAIAAVGDRAWGERRRRGRERRALDAQFVAFDDEVRALHDAERARLQRASPSIDAVLAGARGGHRIGTASRRSTLRPSGGDRSERAAWARERAMVLPGAPVDAPLTAGVAVSGGAVAARAVLRALAVRLVLSESDVRFVDLPAGWEWLGALAPAGRRTAAVIDGEGESGAEIVLARVEAGETAPARARLRIELYEGVRGELRDFVRQGGEASVCDDIGHVRFDALSHDQAVAIAAAKAAQNARTAASLNGRGVPHDARTGAPGALAVALGWQGATAAVVDLVADGPHAVVVGVTGSGKSELLTAWVTRLCAAYDSSEVAFLLADFKGGAAFDALADLPHVTSTISDLDGGSAARAIQSLRAEIRRRETVLARVGARDIADERVQEPRLVIVVDEFAALRAEHAELVAVFADVAARGRALGMHLVLGTQRATGVFRDELLANCPLRIALRLTDAGDSRYVIGSDAAARIPGDARGRGAALLRRAGDDAAVPTKIVRVDAEEAAQTRARRAGSARPPAPWLPALPARIEADGLRRYAQSTVSGLALGVVDEPQLQRQRVWHWECDRYAGMLVLGGPGSGRSNAVRVAVDAARAAGRTVFVAGVDPEQAWDAVCAAERAAERAAEVPEAAPVGAPLLALDDLDSWLARLPDEHALAAVARLTELLRAGPTRLLIVASALRPAGAVARLHELFAARLVLPYPTRAEASAAGLPAEGWDAQAPPGRAALIGRAGIATVQLLVAGDETGEGTFAVAAHSAAHSAAHETAPRWRPSACGAMIVTRRASGVRAALEAQGLSPLTPGEIESSMISGGPMVKGAPIVVGSPDDWQRAWAVRAALGDDIELVVDANCGSELRMLGLSRELPPYAASGAGRAWAGPLGQPLRRVTLDGL